MGVLLGFVAVIVLLIVARYEKYKYEWQVFDEMLARARDGFDEKWDSKTIAWL